MNIQTISIVVPTKGCINNCHFCISKMHQSSYEKCFDETNIKKRIKWALMNGINTCVLTGTGEVLQNRVFLEKLSKIFKRMDHPFPNIELQTTGVMMTRDNINLLKTLGVNTISLSVSNLFNDDENINIIGVPLKQLKFKLVELSKLLKDNGFNVRILLNMTSSIDGIDPGKIFSRLSELNADQVTFHKLWYNKDVETDQTEWVKEHSCKKKTLHNIQRYIIEHGNELYRLPFGTMAYSISKISTVIDENCMGKNRNDKLKYVILRENGKLYCQWDDEGSLIF